MLHNNIILFILLSTPVQQTEEYNLRIGLLLPFDDPYLKPLVGYETSAGAVTVALDRIKHEQLLDGANVR